MPPKKAKTWNGRVFLGRDQNGKQLYHWVGRYPTRRERDDAVARARTERPWEPGTGTELTCSEWADRMLERMQTGTMKTRGGRHYKASSIDTARASLKAFRRQFGDRTPSSITRVEAEDWAATMPTGALPTVIQLMNYIYGAEALDRNRFAGLSRKATGRRDTPPPTPEQMMLLLASCTALGDYAPMMSALLVFGSYMLMRPGELFAITWDDLDLDAGATGRAQISRRLYRGQTDLPKSNRARGVTIPPPARDALDALLTMRGYEADGFVFRNKTGGQLTQPTLTAYWAQVKARAGLDFDFYLATKHWGVHYMKVRLGLPDAAIAAQTGWAESTITKMIATYAHAVDERRLDEIDAAFTRNMESTNA